MCIGTEIMSTMSCPHAEFLSPCTHEEADTRMLLHAYHSSVCGARNVMIRTVDTDVVVIALSHFDSLGLNELWIAFGVGDKLRYIAIHTIVTTLGIEKCKSLPFFHALTGCDTTSSFLGHGKKGAWDTWNLFPEVSSTFVLLSNKPSLESVQQCLKLIERFIILLYDRTSGKDSVNSARKHLFTKKSRQMQNLPPTQAALMEHIKRACYQAGYCWACALQTEPELPSPSDWGWQKLTDKWEPKWSSLQPLSNSCSELISCQCKKGCTKRCKCHKACLPCTALCYCDGTCRE